MTSYRVGTREGWLSARAELLQREKEHLRAGDELARLRRELPWVPVAKDYTFQSEHGLYSLGELFEDRSQLAIYHFMFGPDYDGGCVACSATADGFNGVLAHLKARDVTMVCVSRAPLERLVAYRERMGWSFTWVSSHESDFNFDFGVSASEGIHDAPGAPLLEANELKALKRLDAQPAFRENPPLVTRQNAQASGIDVGGYLSEGHGFSTFAREGDSIYHCYATYSRGTEFLMAFYPILDRVPKGRDEGELTMSWLRRHDEYEGE